MRNTATYNVTSSLYSFSLKIFLYIQFLSSIMTMKISNFSKLCNLFSACMKKVMVNLVIYL